MQEKRIRVDYHAPRQSLVTQSLVFLVVRPRASFCCHPLCLAFQTQIRARLPWRFQFGGGVKRATRNDTSLHIYLAARPIANRVRRGVRAFQKNRQGADPIASGGWSLEEAGARPCQKPQGLIQKLCTCSLLACGERCSESPHILLLLRTLLPQSIHFLRMQKANLVRWRQAVEDMGEVFDVSWRVERAARTCSSVHVTAVRLSPMSSSPHSLSGFFLAAPRTPPVLLPRPSRTSSELFSIMFPAPSFPSLPERHNPSGRRRCIYR